MLQGDLPNRIMQAALVLVIVVGSSCWMLGIGRPLVGSNALRTEIEAARASIGEATRLIDQSRAAHIDRQRLATEIRLLSEQTRTIRERVRTVWFDRKLKGKTESTLRLIDDTQTQLERLSADRRGDSLNDIRSKLIDVLTSIDLLELDLCSNAEHEAPA